MQVLFVSRDEDELKSLFLLYFADLMGGKNGPEGGNRIVLASQSRLQTVMEQSPGAEPFGDHRKTILWTSSPRGRLSMH